MPSQPTQPEFAEQYTKAESIRIVVLGTIAGAAVIFLGKAWLFPAISEFARTAHCRTLFGFDGVAVLWYSLFVGLPLHAAVLLLATVGWRGYKTIRDGQFPPQREKVTRPTRIRRGLAARRIGYLHLIACVPLFALAVWGYYQAEKAILKPIAAQQSQVCKGLTPPLGLALNPRQSVISSTCCK